MHREDTILMCQSGSAVSLSPFAVVHLRPNHEVNIKKKMDFSPQFTQFVLIEYENWTLYKKGI